MKGALMLSFIFVTNDGKYFLNTLLVKVVLLIGCAYFVNEGQNIRQSYIWD